MTKVEELAVFNAKAQDLLESKYILADIKIAHLLQAIASSDMLMALFKNCLVDFDYAAAKKRYLVKNKYLSGDKGEFVLPESAAELLSFTLNVLLDVDSKTVDLNEFIAKYFYEDGSFSSGYAAFLNKFIKPFASSVDRLARGIIDGSLQDPQDALIEYGKKAEEAARIKAINDKKDEELAKKTYGENIKAIRTILLDDKVKIANSNLKEYKKREIICLIDMLANAVESEDLQAIDYAFLAYKYMTRAYPSKFMGRARKVGELLVGVVNEL